MNKEELIKLSRENLRKSKQGSLCECYDEAFIKGYELSKKRIAELEKENESLKKTYRKQRNKRIDDLQKENTELKEELKKWKDGIALKDEEIGCIETDFNTFKSNAKEIIKDQKELLDRVLSGAETLSDFAQNTLHKAEQFLKDKEKPEVQRRELSFNHQAQNYVGE